MSSDSTSTKGRASADGPPPADYTPPRQSCSLCKRRKLRCDRQLPCSSCVRLNFECIYEGARSQQTLRRHRAQKPSNPSGPARSSFDPSEASSPEARPRPVAKKTLHYSATSTGWSVDQLSAENMAELEQAFFRTIHLSIPMLHQFRYTTATVSEPRLRPPNYLRYIICALGASVSPTYSPIHHVLYRASRKNLEESELNDTSNESIPLARPQAWILIAVYELLQMSFHRWWMSTAQAVRLTQVMGLHSVDKNRPSKRLFAIAKDWTELEEQRRTFWQAFCLDRHAAFGHGCPMLIDEKDIHTLLPVSEDAFESCLETETTTLHSALHTHPTPSLPRSASFIVLTAETGHRLKLLQQDSFPSPAPSPSSLPHHHQNDTFWSQITHLDSTLHFAFSLPPHLPLPFSSPDHIPGSHSSCPLLTHLHLTPPTSTIQLHLSAEDHASSHGITPSSLLTSQALRLAAAEMVASTIRLANTENVNPSLMHPFTGLALATAARVFLRNLTVRQDESQRASLGVLLEALGALQSGVVAAGGGYLRELDTEFPGVRKALFGAAGGVGAASAYSMGMAIPIPIPTLSSGHLVQPIPQSHPQPMNIVFRASETPSTTSSFTPPHLGGGDQDFDFAHPGMAVTSAGFVNDGSGRRGGGGGHGHGQLDLISDGYHQHHHSGDGGDKNGWEFAGIASDKAMMDVGVDIGVLGFGHGGYDSADEIFRNWALDGLEGA